MTTPYQILGVAVDADQDAIVKAYRFLAKRYHPDIAGDRYRDSFEEAQLAYDMLSDPEQRAEYDRTGAWPNKKPEGAEQSEVFNTLMQVFSAVVGRVQDVEHTDLVKEMKTAVTAKTTEFEQGKRQAEQALSRLLNIQNRLKLKKKNATENVFSKLLDSNVKAAQAHIAQFDNGIRVMNKVADFIADYKYDFEKVADMSLSQRYGFSQF